MKKHTVCPVCLTPLPDPVMELRDHFLTGETFHLLKCKQCGCGVTDPWPEEEELKRYYRSMDYISHSASSKGLINKLYLGIRIVTLRQKYRLICRLSRRSRGAILDVGCGSGELLHLFSKKHWIVSGIETDEQTRLEAVRKYHLPVGDSRSLNEIRSGSCDVITLWHSLEHIARPSETLEQLRRILTPGGILLVAVPNHASLDAMIYGPCWAAWDVPRHLFHFTYHAMETLMRQHHFRIIHTLPMKRDAYYISLLSERYKHGRINYARALRNGWRSNRYARKNNHTCSSMIYVLKPENAYF
ncbi:MAG TPA: class I SAM-dependent methyltransferase [Bacteroidales bacterium]|nr:class I SAM-dependent methyltransferase [Bacteroidales bacterium]HRZ20086.1 class I SAM-dependent methyltransferase [Bacteroidales bacterium]